MIYIATERRKKLSLQLLEAYDVLRRRTRFVAAARPIWDVRRPNRGAMFGLDLLALMAIAALPVGLISFEVFRASRSARRNREERCGNCGGPLYAPGAMAGPSLLQGHLVCEPCAAKERRDLKRSLVAAGGITASTVLALAAVAIWAPSQLGAHPWIPAIATALEYPVLFAGAVAWMKRANRRAAERLALQAQPSLGAPSDFTLAPTVTNSTPRDGSQTASER
ncbi:MAG: hypothetical protein U0163_17040 [Gemmatimonadaceae bacterium]